jgi:hypothetical protein
MVFHMLRGQLGDQAFWAGLRQMAREGSQASLGWHDLERIFTRTAGQDLRWFFHQWVERAGAPALAFDAVRTERTAGGWKVAGTIVQAEPAYRLDLRVRLSGDEGPLTERTIRIAGARTPFSLETARVPRRLDGDPGSDLFRSLAAAELPATINDLLTPQRPLVVIATGQEGMLPAARVLLQGLHWQAAEFVGEADLDAAAAPGRDLLLLGWPQRPELRPALPTAMAVDAAGAPLLSDRATVSGDTLFAVLAGRQGRDGVRALFLSSNPDTAGPVAPKIPHYGRYSLLRFAAGRNLVKTTWEAQSSPLTVVLPTETQP